MGGGAATGLVGNIAEVIAAISVLNKSLNVGLLSSIPFFQCPARYLLGQKSYIF